MTEGASTVARLVAAILDGPPTPEEQDLPRCLQEVARIRSGARRILEARLGAQDENRLLTALGGVARNAELPMMALDAIVVEIRGLDLPALPPTGFEQAQGLMRRSGFDICPACAGRILSEPEVEHLRRRRRWATEDSARWSGAVR